MSESVSSRPGLLWSATSRLLVGATLLMGTSCSDSGGDSDTVVFAVARTEADMSTFGGVGGSPGTFLIGAAFEAEEDSVVVATASTKFIHAEGGDDPVIVTIWLELDNEDDPDRCWDSVQAETSAFREAAVTESVSPVEISLVSPLDVAGAGQHHLAVCAIAFRGTVGVGPVALSGIVSTNAESSVTIEIDPS